MPSTTAAPEHAMTPGSPGLPKAGHIPRAGQRGRGDRLSERRASWASGRGPVAVSFWAGPSRR
eukprot:6690750-Pyramimonas_sp.AAC.1